MSLASDAKDAFYAWCGTSSHDDFRKFYEFTLPYAYTKAKGLCYNQNDIKDTLQIAYFSIYVFPLEKRKQIKNPLAYLGKVVASCAIRSNLKNNSRMIMNNSEFMEMFPSKENSNANNGGLYTLVSEALTKMDPTWRQYLELCYVKDIKPNEAAEMVGVTTKRFYAVLHQAREYVRKYVADRGFGAVTLVALDQLLQSRPLEVPPEALQVSIYHAVTHGPAPVSLAQAYEIANISVGGGGVLSGISQLSGAGKIAVAASLLALVGGGVYVLTTSGGLESWPGGRADHRNNTTTKASAPVATNETRTPVEQVLNTSSPSFCTLSGTVRTYQFNNSAETTVAGANIKLVRRDNSIHEVTTDANGHFTIQENDFARIRSLIVSAGNQIAERIVDTERHNLFLAPGNVTIPDIILTPGVSVSGRVINSENPNGISGITVSLGGERISNSMPVAVTGADGSFVIHSVPPGVRPLVLKRGTINYTLETPLNINDTPVNLSNIDFPSFGTREMQLVQTGPAGTEPVNFSNYILEFDGTSAGAITPAGNITLAFTQQLLNAPTSAAIPFRVKVPVLGVALSGSIIPSTALLTNRITLPPFGTAHVHVSAAGSFQCETLQILGQSGNEIAPIPVDPSATEIEFLLKFRLAGETKTNYWLVAPGFAPLPISVGEQAMDLNLTFGTGGFYQGKVLTNSGAAAAGAGLAWIHSGFTIATAVAGPDGTFTSSAAPNIAGATLVIRHAGSELGSITISDVPAVTEGHTVPLGDITLKKRYSLTIEPNATSPPNELYYIDARDSLPGRQINFYGDIVRAGSSRNIGTLEEGEYQISVTKSAVANPAARINQRLATISLAHDTTVEFNNNGSGSLALTLQNQEVSFSMLEAVMLTGKEPYYYSSPVAEGGNASFRDLPSGNYKVCIVPRGSIPDIQAWIQNNNLNKELIHTTIQSIALKENTFSVIENIALTEVVFGAVATGRIPSTTPIPSNAVWLSLRPALAKATAAGEPFGAEIWKTNNMNSNETSPTLPVGKYRLEWGMPDGSTGSKTISVTKQEN